MAAGPLAAQLVWNYVTETGRKLEIDVILAKPEPPYWLSPALGRLDQAQRDLEIPHDPVELGSTFRHP